MLNLVRLPGARLVSHLILVMAIWSALMRVNNMVDPLTSYYMALAAMYATAMFGMVILVGLSGQVPLGNGALMAVGGYIFALTSLNWQTVPILGWQWNAMWSMVFAAAGGIVFGMLVGGIAARLRGPYLAGLTLGIAVGIPAIATRFPDLFGGDNGLMLTVPYPDGGYVTEEVPVDAVVPTDGAVPLDQAPLEEIPLEQAPLDGASAAPGDMLTADNFGSAAPSPASEDLLTADNFGSAAPSPGAGDMLTADNFPTSAPVASDVPLPTESALPTDGDLLGGTDTLVTGGFVLEQWQASLAVTAACVVGFLALNLVRGRQGRVWRAVRDDSVAAAVSGISPAGSKVSAFAVSSVFAAIAGAVFAQLLSLVAPSAYPLGLSLTLLVGVVLGGRASLGGAIVGSVLLVWLPVVIFDVAGTREWPSNITDNAPNLVYGLLVVLVVLIAPGGILGSLQTLVSKIVTRVRPTT